MRAARGRAAAAAGDLRGTCWLPRLSSVTVAAGLSVLAYAQSLSDGSGEHRGGW